MLNIIKKLILCLSLILLINTSHGDESDKFHNLIKNRLKIPMVNNKRSLNIASSVAIILSENLRQTKFTK